MKKISKSQVFLFISTFVLMNLNVGSSWGQKQLVANISSQATECEPVAKVISGDIRYKTLTKLCSRDKVKAANGGLVKIFCYPRGKFLNIIGNVGQYCSQPEKQERRGCTLLDGRNCSTPKGTNEEDEPSLISPHGVVIMNPRPTLSWTTTGIATSYSVQVKGIGVNWEVEVKENSLLYPQEEPAMQPGNVYTINIIAMREEKILGGSSSILMLLSTDKKQEVVETINTLKSLKQSSDELAIDIDAVYEAQNLVHESIQVLNARAKSGTKNPTIYRLMGDRYLIANLPEAANKAYLKARRLAQTADNNVELAKAEAGIKIVSQHLQPPTRIKPAQ